MSFSGHPKRAGSPGSYSLSERAKIVYSLKVHYWILDCYEGEGFKLSEGKSGFHYHLFTVWQGCLYKRFLF